MATDRSNVSDLPPTSGLEIDPNAMLLPGTDGNWVLLGGSPYTLLTLRAPAAEFVKFLRQGLTVNTGADEAHVSVTAAQRLARRLLQTGLAEPDVRAPSLITIADITAVIPALNEANVIGALVASLHQVGIEAVVVVDDASTDETAAQARSAGATVISMSNGVSAGPGAAREAGAAAATTPFVLFIDADVSVSQAWVEPLLRAFGDPAVVAAAPRVRSSNQGGLIGTYERWRSPLDLGARRAAVRPRSRVAYVPTAALLADVAAIRSVGGFDSALRTGEDVDLVWRLHAAGGVIRYEPTSVVEHRPRPTLRAFIAQRRGYGRSAAALDARHPGMVAPLAASGWSVLVWALPVVAWPIGIAAGATTALLTAALLDRKLVAIAQPRTVALKLAMRGHWGVGRQLASAIWRAWLPVALLASLASRRARMVVIAAAVLPNAAEWHTTRPDVNPVSFIAMRLLDDASYCAGVWDGCVRQHSFRAVWPHLANWPGRTTQSKVE